MKHKNENKNYNYNELRNLCDMVKNSVIDGNFDSYIKEVRMAMEKYPHAPEPHNLMGIILEKTGEHILAMRHFRAAWALDPTYLPARHNLETYGTFFSHGECAFDERDIAFEKTYDCEAI